MEGSPEDEFAAQVARLAREFLGAEVTQLDDWALRVLVPGAEPATIHLYNLYLETRALTDEARSLTLRNLLMATISVRQPTTWDEAAGLLVPIARPTGWAASLAGRGALRRPLVPFVDVLCAIDFETATSYVSDADLFALGVDRATVEERALDNLTGSDPQVDRL